MAVREKLVPRLMSVSAMLAAVAISGWLYVAGEKNPRAYTANMMINHHNGYGRTYACNECHVPGGGFILTPTCVTSSCHGELVKGVSTEDAIAILQAGWKENNKTDKTELTAKAYLKLHTSANYANCASCHSEHKPKEKAAGHASAPPLTHYHSIMQVATQTDTDQHGLTQTHTDRRSESDS